MPSGSCGGTIEHRLPHLFDDDPNSRARADASGARAYELVRLLTEVMGIKSQPCALLHTVERLSLTGMADPEVCCGFGGTFCVKYPDISTRMVSDKATDVVWTGADTVLAGDMGRLLDIAGRLKREGSPVRVRHVAEVLAGMTDEVPPIGASRGGASRGGATVSADAAV